MSQSRVDVCKSCGGTKRIKGLGMCSPCYKKDLAARNGVQAASPVGAGKSKASKGPCCTVMVDFSPAPYLHELIQQRAVEEMRDPSRQVLWELKKAMEVVA